LFKKVVCGVIANLGSILVVNGEQNETYISDIQHDEEKQLQ
jgi:hypothetical protein